MTKCMLGNVFVQSYRRPRSMLYNGSRRNRRRGKSRNRMGSRVGKRECHKRDCGYRDDVRPPYSQMDNA
jgi:hypothetical protein